MREVSIDDVIIDDEYYFFVPERLIYPSIKEFFDEIRECEEMENEKVHLLYS